MWAQRLSEPGRLVEVEAVSPEAGALGAGQVTLRLLAGGICGSDLPHFRGSSPPWSRVTSWPAPAGHPLHEIVGEVVASRSDLTVGRHVVGWATDGRGLAEYVVTDADNLVQLDGRLSPVHAVVVQPLACVLYALSRLRSLDGARVAVLGLGPIGVLFTHAAKAAGAAHVTGVDRVDRTDAAATFGIDEVVHATSRDWAASLTAGVVRPDVVIEAIGHQEDTLDDAVTAVAPHGQIYYFGIPDTDACPFALETFLRKDLTLLAGTTHERRTSLSRAEAYLTGHPELADALVTHVLPFDAAQRAFTLACEPAPGQLKIVLSANGRRE